MEIDLPLLTYFEQSYHEYLTKQNISDLFSQQKFSHDIDGNLVIHIISSKLQDFFENLDDDDSELSHALLSDLETWLEDNVFSQIPKSIITNSFTKYIHQYAMDKLIQYRMSKAFELIVEFPDSIPTLTDLKKCLQSIDRFSVIGNTLRNVIHSRLLHLGASTSQILDFYHSLIKSLRIVDSSDRLLNFVASPIRTYLKSRNDTLKCIITSLVEEDDSELQEELRKGKSLMFGVDEDDEEQPPPPDWFPNKYNKDFKSENLNATGLDYLALLISIYGSTELFITEYKNLLSQRMISNTLFTVDQEVSNIELLKIRFGEDSLHSCEVIIKDIEDSKRINNALSKYTEYNKLEFPVDYAIISDYYWPTLNVDTIKLHPKIEKSLQIFSKMFGEVKKPKKLLPAHQLGIVDLELEFNSCRKKYTVNPIQANIIFFFDEEDKGSHSVSFNTLYSELEMDEEALIDGLKFWISEGVIKDLDEANASFYEKSFEIIE